MIDIDYDKFEKLFDENIAPYLMQFEKKRIKACWRIFWATIISILYFVILCMVNSYFISSNVLGDIFNFVVISFFIVAICVFLSPAFSYKGNIKSIFYSNLFNFFDLKYSTNSGRKIIEDVCAESGIFAKVDDICIDDKLSGKYKKLPITIIDTKISYKYIYFNFDFNKDGIQYADQTFFNGIFIATKINKDFKKSILIKTERNIILDFISAGINIVRFFLPFKPYILEKGMSIDKSKVKSNIKLEDVEFEKHFEVYGDDQVEARYMLTTAFIDRLLKYQKKYSNNLVEVVLDNDINSDFNIYFFVNSGIDYFEIPIYKSLLNKNLFYNILKQLTELLEIIDALKLEQNIGM